MTVPGFELSEAARRDIANLRLYTRANWGVAKEEEYVADLFARLTGLVEAPLLGRARPELGERIRSLLSDRHLILYRPKLDSGVSILRVMHHSQQLPGDLG